MKTNKHTCCFAFSHTLCTIYYTRYRVGVIWRTVATSIENGINMLIRIFDYGMLYKCANVKHK